MESRFWFFWCFIFLCLLENSSQRLHQSKARRGSVRSSECLAPLPEPSPAFVVVWNHPDPCFSRWHFKLSDFGIVANQHHRFMGEQVKLFYNPGKWPMYSRNGTAINGGIPQEMDSSHFQAARVKFEDNRGSPNFSGLAVIDFEAWRPLFVTNFGTLRVYQHKSRDRVQHRHPDYNVTRRNEAAENRFEATARVMFEKTLLIGQDVMPKAHWGYYLHPRIWGNVSHTIHLNNKLDWLWTASTGLYPSIYNRHPLTEGAKEHIAATISEALRVQGEFSRPNTPVYAYVLSQKNATDFYTTEELDITLGLPAKMGVSGLVLWGSSQYYHGREAVECSAMEPYFRNLLGPYLLSLNHFLRDCSAALCSRHGRCALKDTSDYQKPTSSDGHVSSDYSDYECRCYSPWGGKNCQTRHTLSCQQGRWSQQDQLIGK